MLAICHSLLTLLNLCSIYCNLWCMMMLKNNIPHACDRAANSYDEHSHAQKSAGVKLIQLLKTHQPQAKYILDLGCGTIMTTELLAAQYHYQHFHALDIAEKLLAKATARLN